MTHSKGNVIKIFEMIHNVDYRHIRFARLDTEDGVEIGDSIRDAIIENENEDTEIDFDSEFVILSVYMDLDDLYLLVFYAERKLLRNKEERKEV